MTLRRETVSRKDVTETFRRHARDLAAAGFNAMLLAQEIPGTDQTDVVIIPYKSDYTDEQIAKIGQDLGKLLMSGFQMVGTGDDFAVTAHSRTSMDPNQFKFPI
jgi:hypothetical protein